MDGTGKTQEDETRQVPGSEGSAIPDAAGQEAVIEAVLFSMGGSVDSEVLAKAAGISEAQADEAAGRLARRYAESGSALEVVRIGDGWQLCVKSLYYENLIRVVKSAPKPVLTQAALETLSIVAYRQPVTRLEIEKIRGVRSDRALNRLIDYGLICEAGRMEAPGRPVLFATTEEFLRRFGVSGSPALPKLDAGEEEKLAKEAEAEVGMSRSAQGTPSP